LVVKNGWFRDKFGRLVFMDVQGILFGVVLNLAAGTLALYSQALEESGAVIAVILGLLVFLAGGWEWFLVLMSFFALASVASAYKEKEKESVAKEFEKGATRDYLQVLANGFIATLFAFAYSGSRNPLAFVGFAAAIATVAGDTIATEFGVLGKSPILVTTGKRVEKGTSGAVSAFGTIALAGASAAIAVLSLFISGGVGKFGSIVFFSSVFLGGVAGGFADSFFGATIQRSYHCPKCRKETERKVHSCGTKCSKTRGFEFVNNDIVNLLASIAGSVIGLLIYSLGSGQALI
jgi:uncharacterized protein (TIGR00297 family)